MKSNYEMKIVRNLQVKEHLSFMPKDKLIKLYGEGQEQLYTYSFLLH